MEVKVPRGLSYQREGQPANRALCKFNLVGKCNRNPCRFLHSQPPILTELSSALPKDWPKKNTNFSGRKNLWTLSGSKDGIRKTPNHNRPKNSLASSSGSVESGNKISTLKTPPKVCEYWLSGNCVKGDNCRFMHSRFCGNGISMLAKLDGHQKAISGIALPLGSDKLYSGSKDGTVRVWDCHTGQCANVINLGDEVGCLICEGPWVFIGMPNLVRAWNIESSSEFILNEPVGQVYCMVVANEMLFVGAQNGGIFAWKGSPGAKNPFHHVGSLRGHSHSVTCLTVGRNMLYTGSMDNTIRVWDLDTLQSVMTLDGHTDAPMSLLCWDKFLFSCSLDKTIKVWGVAGGNFEVTHTHNEEHGLLALCGLNDFGQPVLLCACNDNSVHLYDLPLASIFSKREVRDIQVGPDVFTGDGTGMLSVWKLLAKSSGRAFSLKFVQETSCCINCRDWLYMKRHRKNLTLGF